MVKFLLTKPVSVVMIFVALVLLGLVMVKRVPISPLPNINIPEITIHINKKNTSAKEIDKLIVNPIRSQLLQVAGLSDIHSDTRDDIAVLKLKFNYNTNIDLAYIEVNEKIDLTLNSLPKDTDRPIVVKSSATDIPVLFLNLTFRDAGRIANNFAELSEFAQQSVKKRLEELPEIAFVDITGLSYPEISIEPNPVALSALNLTEDDFAQIISSHNLVFNNVVVRDGILEYSVRFAGANLTSVEDIQNIDFTKNGRILKLKDIATVKTNRQDSKGIFLANNSPAINMALMKQPDSKMDDLRADLQKLLQDLRHDYPNIEIKETQDQTELLDFSIQNLKQDLSAGCLMAFLMMFFFLRNFKSPLIIGITVPVCLTICLLFFGLIHLTINIISLSGLVLGVGLMIDNSIIVIDNISQYCERGFDLQDACVKGTTEVIRPLLSSALTTSSVFIPLIFLSGLGGALFYDQAMAVTIGLFISLIVSITLLLVLYYLFHKTSQESTELKPLKRYSNDFFEKIYEIGFRWTFNNKFLSLVIVLLMVITSSFLLRILKKEKFPAFEQQDAVIKINWNQNITIQQNRSLVVKLIKTLGNRVVWSEAMIGEEQYLLSKEMQLSSSEANIYIKAIDNQILHKVAEEIYAFMKRNYPDATIEISPPKDIFQQVFANDEPDLTLMITERGNTQLPANEKVDSFYSDLRVAFPNARIKPLIKQSNVIIEANTEQLLLYGLTLDKVYSYLQGRLNSREIGSIQNNQFRIPVVLSDSVKFLQQAINGFIVNDSGIQVPVSSLLTINYRDEYKVIEGGRNGNYIALNIATNTPEEIIKYVNQRIKNTGMEVAFSGSLFSNKSLISEMGVVLSIAVLLLYFILAAQFESLVQPIIVLLELPISLSGGLLMLFIAHNSLNLISMIGLVVICGIVINDSILKIDTVNRLRRVEGMPLKESLHTAGIMRLKSILMTAMTTVLSVLPFLFGSDIGSILQRPLSLVIIGGMLIGTPVSLYFIPLVYWFYYKNKSVSQV